MDAKFLSESDSSVCYIDLDDDDLDDDEPLKGSYIQPDNQVIKFADDKLKNNICTLQFDSSNLNTIAKEKSISADNYIQAPLKRKKHDFCALSSEPHSQPFVMNELDKSEGNQNESYAEKQPIVSVQRYEAPVKNEKNFPKKHYELFIENPCENFAEKQSLASIINQSEIFKEDISEEIKAVEFVEVEKLLNRSKNKMIFHKSCESSTEKPEACLNSEEISSYDLKNFIPNIAESVKSRRYSSKSSAVDLKRNMAESNPEVDFDNFIPNIAEAVKSRRCCVKNSSYAESVKSSKPVISNEFIISSKPVSSTKSDFCIEPLIFKAYNMYPKSRTRLDCLKEVKEKLHSGEEKCLRTLYRVLYDRLPPKDVQELKDEILEFSGFTFNKKSNELAKRKLILQKLQYSSVLKICEILDLKTGTKDIMISNIIKFLLKPIKIIHSPVNPFNSNMQPYVKLEKISIGSLYKSNIVNHSTIECGENLQSSESLPQAETVSEASSCNKKTKLSDPHTNTPETNKGKIGKKKAKSRKSAKLNTRSSTKGKKKSKMKVSETNEKKSLSELFKNECNDINKKISEISKIIEEVEEIKHKGFSDEVSKHQVIENDQKVSGKISEENYEGKSCDRDLNTLVTSNSTSVKCSPTTKSEEVKHMESHKYLDEFVKIDESAELPVKTILYKNGNIVTEMNKHFGNEVDFFEVNVLKDEVIHKSDDYKWDKSNEYKWDVSNQEDKFSSADHGIKEQLNSLEEFESKEHLNNLTCIITEVRSDNSLFLDDPKEQSLCESAQEMQQELEKPGKQLKYFENIKENILIASNSILHRLNVLLFGVSDKPENLKQHILNFDGFHFCENSKEWKRKEFILSLWAQNILKECLNLLCIKYQDDDDQVTLVYRLMKFLQTPNENQQEKGEIKTQVVSFEPACLPSAVMYEKSSTKKKKLQKVNPIAEKYKAIMTPKSGTTKATNVRVSKHQNIYAKKRQKSKGAKQKTFINYQAKVKYIGNLHLLQDFILPALDAETYGNLLKWEDKKEGIFGILWTHKAASVWTNESSAVFSAWDVMKGRPPPETPQEFVDSKQRMRAAFRSIRCVQDLGSCFNYRRYRIKGFCGS